MKINWSAQVTKSRYLAVLGLETKSRLDVSHQNAKWDQILQHKGQVLEVYGTYQCFLVLV